MDIYFVQRIPAPLICSATLYTYLPPLAGATPIDNIDPGSLMYHTTVTIPVGTGVSGCMMPWAFGGQCYQLNTTLAASGPPVPPGWTVARVVFTKINPTLPIPICTPPLSGIKVEIPELTSLQNSCATRLTKVIHCATGDGNFLFRLDHASTYCDHCVDYKYSNGDANIFIDHW